MKCFHHPEVDANQECRICGHPLCSDCTVDVEGAPYCKTCLEARLEGPPPAPVPVPEFKSPKAAGWLSVVPGIGLVYLGEYLKALVVWLLFLGAIQAGDHSDIGGMLVPFIWLAQLIYAIQEARRLNRVRAGAPPERESDLPKEENSPLWGWLLVGIGTLFLFDQFDLIRFGDLFERFWPVLIIVLGIQILLRGRLQKMPSGEERSTGEKGLV